MPHSDKVPVFELPEKLKYGELPETKFLDAYDAIKVQMWNWPDPEKTKETLFNVLEASWGKDATKTKDLSPDIINTVIDDMARGRALGLGLEFLNFTFSIENVGLEILQCITRHRIGVTFSSRSTVVMDLRHDDFLVPRCLEEDPVIMEKTEKFLLDAKALYASMIDSGISAQVARNFLPRCHGSYIFMHISLLALMNFYSKRSDISEEPVELNIICEKIKDLVCEKFPEFEPLFVKGCDSGRCMHSKPGYRAGSLYLPDGPDDRFDFNKNNYFYQTTKKEILKLDNPPLETRKFVGRKEVEV